MVKYDLVEHDQLGDVADVLRASFPVYNIMGLTSEYLEKIMEIDEDVKNGYIYGAWVDGRLVSVNMVVERRISIYPSFLPVAGVANVATKPEYRGRGLAKKLLSHALNDLMEKGFSASVLFAAYGDPAYRIYRRQGYCDLITYWNRVCVLDDVDQAMRLIEDRFSKLYGEIKVLDKKKAENCAGTLKQLYYRFVNKRYRGSVYRSTARWRGILVSNPFETWFLGDPDNKVMVLTDGKVHGYSILYYMRDSVLYRSHDRNAGVVTEVVSRDTEEASALLYAVLKKAKEDGIGTLTFRLQPDIEEEIPICKRIGSSETLMFKVLDPSKLFDDLRKFIETRPIDKIEFGVRSRQKDYVVRVSNGKPEIVFTSKLNTEIIIDEAGLLRMLLATSTAYDEYRGEYLIIRNGNVKKTLDTINDFLKGRRRHYLSLIDKW